MNRSEELLDQCVTAMQTQGRTVEDCLALYPAQQADLEPLLRLADRLQAARSLQASPGFKATSVHRLQTLAYARPAARRGVLGLPAFFSALSGSRPLRPAQARPRFAPILAALLLVALILSSVGVVAASAQALPGDLLYPVKRVQETVQLTFSPDEASRAGLYLEFATRRIDEALSLLQQNRAGSLDQALSDYNDQIQSELQLLANTGSLSPAQQSDLANRLALEISNHETSLAALARQAPDSVQANLATALAASKQAHTQAIQIIQNLGTNPPNLIFPSSTPTPTPTQLPPTKAPPSILPPSSAILTPTHFPFPTSGFNSTIRPRLTSFPTLKPSATRPNPVAIRTRTPQPLPSNKPTLTGTKPSILPFVNPTPTPTKPSTLPFVNLSPTATKLLILPFINLTPTATKPSILPFINLTPTTTCIALPFVGRHP